MIMLSPEKENSRSDRDRATACFLEKSGFIRLVAYESAPSPDLLGDIVNDVFIYFVERADRWDYRRDLTPLLRKITRHIALRHWREHLKNLPGALGEVFEFLREAKESESDRLENLEEEMAALDLCLIKLPAKYRQLIEAHYFGKIKLVEIAKEQDIKIGTLKKTMCRVRSTLRECVERSLGKGDCDVQ
ncbi:MAG: sigma-70 family RNA polymerase sigma factor [Planctomycetia bacterium]|nr:sigma-70 family RNA polymerase sigma factor [Planctomycetia bacterium]